MKFTIPIALLASAITALAQGTTPLLNTPSGVTQCLRTLLTWSGGEAPYTLTVQPGGQPSAATLENLGVQTGTSFSWLVTFPAGTSLFLRLRDNSGRLSETAAFTVEPGADTTCRRESISPAPAPSGSTPPPSAESTPPTGGNPSASPSQSSPSGSSSGPAPSGDDSSAVKVGGSLVAAGAVALGMVVLA